MRKNFVHTILWLGVVIIGLLVFTNPAFAYVGPAAVLGFFGPLGAVVGVVLLAVWVLCKSFFKKQPKDEAGTKAPQESDDQKE